MNLRQYHRINKIPLYTHNCNKCIFIKTDQHKDFYYCANESALVIRYSSKLINFETYPIVVINSLSYQYQEYDYYKHILNSATSDMIGIDNKEFINSIFSVEYKVM